MPAKNFSPLIADRKKSHEQLIMEIDDLRNRLAARKRQNQELSHKLACLEYKSSPEGKGRYQRLFDAIQEGFAVAEILLDEAGKAHDCRLLEVNKAFSSLIGFPQEETNGKTLRELFPGIDLQWLEIFKHVALANGSTQFSTESRLLGKWLEVYAFSPEYGKFGILLIDVTERKQVQEALYQERELLQRIFDNVPVLFVRWDPRFHRFTLNCHAEAILGWTTEDANEGGFMQKVYPDPVYRAEVADFMRSLDFGWREWNATTSDGEKIPISWANIQLTNSAMIGIGVDLRERKQSEAALRKARDELEMQVNERTIKLQKRAEQLSRLSSELTMAEQRERQRLADILHDDLQQLLVAARLRLETLAVDLSEERQKDTQQIVALLERSIRSSRNLTKDLAPPVLKKEGFGAALEWLADWMRETHGLSVKLRIDNGAEFHKQDTRILIFQSIKELLFNIVKHAGVNQAEIDLACGDDNFIQILVMDHGTGFDPETIFSSDKAGVGFGLLSIRERLVLMGGGFYIDSAIGSGACCRMLVPRETQPRRGAPNNEPCHR